MPFRPNALYKGDCDLSPMLQQLRNLFSAMDQVVNQAAKMCYMSNGQVAVPLVFGSLRSSGTGQRIFIGILLGFGFYLLTRMAGQMGQVYELNPVLASFAPGLVVFAIGFYMLRRL